MMLGQKEDGGYMSDGRPKIRFYEKLYLTTGNAVETI